MCNEEREMVEHERERDRREKENEVIQSKGLRCNNQRYYMFCLQIYITKRITKERGREVEKRWMHVTTATKKEKERGWMREENDGITLLFCAHTLIPLSSLSLCLPFWHGIRI